MYQVVLFDRRTNLSPKVLGFVVDGLCHLHLVQQPTYVINKGHWWYSAYIVSMTHHKTFSVLEDEIKVLQIRPPATRETQETQLH